MKGEGYRVPEVEKGRDKPFNSENAKILQDLEFRLKEDIKSLNPSDFDGGTRGEYFRTYMDLALKLVQVRQMLRAEYGRNDIEFEPMEAMKS